MCGPVSATGHIKDSVPLVKKSRASCPGGRFPPSFIHQVIIITALNKLYDYVLALKMTLCPTGHKTSTQTQTFITCQNQKPYYRVAFGILCTFRPTHTQSF